MSKCCLFLLTLFVPYLAFAQVAIGDGTVVVVNSTNDELVIAADSRVTHLNGQKPNESNCKIATFDHQIVFSSVGATSFDAPIGSGLVPWDNLDVLTDIAKNSRVTADAPRIV